MKQFKLFILTFICAFIATPLGAVESLQHLCAEQIVQEFELVSDDSLEQFRNNPNFIKEKKGLDNVPQNLKNQIKDAILKSYHPAADAQRLSDWIVRLLGINPIILNHSGWVWAVACSPDGNRVAIPSADNTVKILDSQNGTPLCTLTGHNDAVLSGSWEPDGNRIVTGSVDGTAKIWDSQNGLLLRDLSGDNGHNGPIFSVSWSPNNNRIATGSYDKTAKIWDPENGALLQTLEDDDPVYELAWFSEGARLITCSANGTQNLWDPENGVHCLSIFVDARLKDPLSDDQITAFCNRTAKICNQFQNLSLEQVLFLALVYHHIYHNKKLRLDYSHQNLRDIYNSLPADIQNIIIIKKMKQIEKTQNNILRQKRRWQWGGLAAGAAVVGFVIYKWLRK